MSIQNNTAEIKDGKVIFSKEVLSYFESLRNEETSEWIDKYFEVLSDKSNPTATKYNLHHIRPCCTFKDKEHKNRKETLKLGDNFNGNIIKVSIYNHLLSHYYLWKIYNDWNSKRAIESMCCQDKYIDDLSEDELKEVAILKEECAKENQTKEERRKYRKNWYEKNKDKELTKINEWTEKNKDRVKKNKDNWYQKNKERISKESKEHRAEKRIKEREYRHNNKDKIKKRNNRPCYDPIRKDICTFSILRHRKNRNKEIYKNIMISECLIKTIS